MSSIPAAGRVSDLMRSDQLLTTIENTQSQLLTAQMQVSTGNEISTPSDNPVLAGQVININGLLGQITQYQANATSASALLGAADTALSSVSSLLTQAQSLAMSSVSSTNTATQQAANAQQMASIISQLQRLGNQKFQGRYLFDGQAGQGDPFVSSNGGILYTGGTQPLQLDLDSDWTLSLPLDGGTVFGAQSAPVGGGTDLDPTASASTPLADLGGAAGDGVTLGTIQVGDGLSAPVSIDLSQCATIGDVITTFNASAPRGTTMSLAANGQQLLISSSKPGATVSVSDVTGAAAEDLGITASGSGATVTGRNLDPLLTVSTPISSLLGGAGLDSHGIQISNGTQSATVTFNPAGTVGDMLNAINNAGVGVQASISSNGQSLQLVNTLSGTSLKVSENGGSTATQLGLRTFQAATTLASLAGGQGVAVAGNGQNDFSITLHSGSSFDVSLSSCQTVGDVINAINTAAGNNGDLAASISPTGGIELTDNTAGGGSLTVAALNGSAAAANLGLAGQTANATMVGTDVSGLQTGGLFSDLTQLQQAIANSDTVNITRLTQSLQTDMNNVAQVQGSVGVQEDQVNAQTTQLGDQQTADQSLLSQIDGADLVHAAVQVQQLQNQLTASLQVMGVTLNVSLLNYLPT